MSERKLAIYTYRRKSDGKIAERYISHILDTDIYGTYYVIAGEPANITPEEVSDKEKWEKVKIDFFTRKIIDNE